MVTQGKLKQRSSSEPVFMVEYFQKVRWGNEVASTTVVLSLPNTAALEYRSSC